MVGIRVPLVSFAATIAQKPSGLVPSATPETDSDGRDASAPSGHSAGISMASASTVVCSGETLISAWIRQMASSERGSFSKRELIRWFYNNAPNSAAMLPP